MIHHLHLLPHRHRLMIQLEMLKRHLIMLLRPSLFSYARNSLASFVPSSSSSSFTSYDNIASSLSSMDNFDSASLPDSLDNASSLSESETFHDPLNKGIFFL